MNINVPFYFTISLQEKDYEVENRFYIERNRR